MAVYYETSSLVLSWVRTGHPWHIFCWKHFHLILYSYPIHPPAWGYTQQSSTYTRAEAVKYRRNFSPQTPISLPSLRLCPQEKQLISKDLPSPSKSLGCHRSSRTRLQTKNHLWQAKGIYCLSSKKFCTPASPARDWRRVNAHITRTTGSGKKGPKGALRCPLTAVLAVTWA